MTSEEFIQLTPTEFKSIYTSLAKSDNDLCDVTEDCSFIVKNIAELLAKWNLIDTEELLKNTNLINQQMAKLLSFFKKEYNFKKPGLIFICYCDYFDLEYHVVYLILHEKIQKLINYSCRCMIGQEKYSSYRKKENTEKYGENVQVKTLFDLL